MHRIALCCTCIVAMGCDGVLEAEAPTSSMDTRVSPPMAGGTAVADRPSSVPTGVDGEPEAPPPADQAPMVPVDDRLPVLRQLPPPPISGGTLLVLKDGYTVVVSDSDRDRVSVVDLRGMSTLGDVTLEPGDEPGRLIEDAAGLVHVVLRGSGAIATIDPVAREVLDRRAVCIAPRGVAYDAASDLVHVACMDGRLVSLSAAGGDTERDLRVAPDLRDVVITASGLHVSRFKAATLLDVDAEGNATAEHTLKRVAHAAQDPFSREPESMRHFAPALARRALALRNGDVMLLHQRELEDTIELGEGEDLHDSEGIGQPEPMSIEDLFGGSAYGSAGSCGSIVQAAISIVDVKGEVTHSLPVAGVVLAVDIAVSPDGRSVAIADAGQRDLDAPTRSFFDPGVAGGVTLLDLSSMPLTASENLGSECLANPLQVEGQPIAVGFTADGALLVQSREPALLQVISSEGLRSVDLGGDSVRDTGHDIFHQDAGAGIACASCHGEGGDDGHVWNFSTFGPRRTQAVNVGLEGTTPFHWSGDMDDLGMLVSEVFVERMGGVEQSEPRVSALGRWLFALHAPEAPRAAEDEAAVRGKLLFESEDVGCAGCHNGEKLTNNETVDVGTGEPLQVPSLRAVAYRAPFIHDGCALSLRERFDPSCGGGDAHGKTSQLSAEELDDLVAYLESL